MLSLQRFYRWLRSGQELCFYVEARQELSCEELSRQQWLLAETFGGYAFSTRSFLAAVLGEIIELGPLGNFETAFSTNAVSICRACGLGEVTRLEKSRRYRLPDGRERQNFVAANHDRMTETEYREPLLTFDTGIVPARVLIVPILTEGRIALEKINQELGLGMDDWDIRYYEDLFANNLRHNPTDVELFQLGQANSEHSRHWFFKGRLVIDGVEMSDTLMQIVREPLDLNPGNSIIAFNDNSSGILGYEVDIITPVHPGQCSRFQPSRRYYHFIFTAETHNHPSGVAPFPGAETGAGGRIRDVQATGQGALVIAGTAGYCTGNLRLPGHWIPGEREDFHYPDNLASPLQIMVDASNGASDYGNKFGEPVIAGFCRTFGLRLSDGERREWIKPIMFTGGIGQIDDKHITKGEPEPGMLIIQIGGPAYRIGIGGGSASSMASGQNTAQLDYNSVQRGDAEMENKVNRVIRACVEMGEKNPIVAIHDQGAGGPANILTELVAPAGGRIEIRNIVVGDRTMSVLEIWGGEYQERIGLLIWPDRLAQLQAICQREKVNCEVLGEITGDGRVVVHDSQDDSTPVDLPLADILTKMPQKTFPLQRKPKILQPLVLPSVLTVPEALRRVFLLPAVGSKGFLVRKVDRSVTGLVARQQCCGPLQLPVSDVAVVAKSHFGLSGAATAIGEQPIKMLVNAAAGARMAVGEALTNLVWARVSSFEHIRCSANWMWPAKFDGEGAQLYDAAVAMSDLMIKLGIAVDGGKDSLSMAAKVGDENVKAPGQLVVSAYCTVPDVTRVITPDIKFPGETHLGFIDLAQGKNRLGGSALAQAFGQIGDEPPDVDDPELLRRAFLAVQVLISEGLVLSGHDRSDGGLITTLAEMAMSGNCGLRIQVRGSTEAIPRLFSEELGLVIEFLPNDKKAIDEILREFNVPLQVLGSTVLNKKVEIKHRGNLVLDVSTADLRRCWEATSDALEKQQMNVVLAGEQSTFYDRLGPIYHLSFTPAETSAAIISKQTKPKVAILREEGSNGDREMTSAFYAAGFEPWDVNMSDLLGGDVRLEQFQGLATVGGFSYADVLGSAKGWAGVVKFNEGLASQFQNFYERPDIFSFNVCNGCQWAALLGWVPWSGIPQEQQPRFIQNLSQRFEPNWVMVKILDSPAIMLKGMAGSVLGVWVAHGEGYLHCPNPEILKEIILRNLAPLAFVDDKGLPTANYPFNPNGSPHGIAALCSPDGRHLAIMPHPERAFLKWQWGYMPEEWKTETEASPWLKLFQNARQWCEQS